MELTRPNGKLYRARKPPVVEFFEDYWPFSTFALVIRCSDLATAQLLANAEIKRCDSDCRAGEGKFGWWRNAIRDGEPYWVYDEVRGVPGWCFEVID